MRIFVAALILWVTCVVAAHGQQAFGGSSGCADPGCADPGCGVHAPQQRITYQRHARADCNCARCRRVNIRVRHKCQCADCQPGEDEGGGRPDDSVITPQSGGFAAPPQTGTEIESGRSVGLGGFALSFPELRLELPAIELPRLMRFRRGREMKIDHARAPYVEDESGIRVAHQPVMQMPMHVPMHFPQHVVADEPAVDEAGQRDMGEEEDESGSRDSEIDDYCRQLEDLISRMRSEGMKAKQQFDQINECLHQLNQIAPQCPQCGLRRGHARGCRRQVVARPSPSPRTDRAATEPQSHRSHRAAPLPPQAAPPARRRPSQHEELPSVPSGNIYPDPDRTGGDEISHSNYRAKRRYRIQESNATQVRQATHYEAGQQRPMHRLRMLPTIGVGR